MKSLLLATILLLPAVASAQKPPAKPAAKPPATAGVKGAGQLAGAALRFGDLFALDSGFTYQILSARYSVEPFDDYTHLLPGRNEKLLILQVAIKNNRRDADNFFDPANHTLQAIDSSNQNYDSAAYRLRSKPGEGFSPNLKPGQGLGQAGADPVEIAFRMPLDTRIVKLILQRRREGTREEVVRFFLAGATEAEAGGKPDPKNVVAPLPAWALPGATAAPGTSYPSGGFLFRFEGFASAEKLGEEEPEEGKRWVFARIAVKNALAASQPLFEFYQGDSIVDLVLVDAEGEKYMAAHFLKASKDEAPEGGLDPGEERVFRIGFKVPREAKFKTILLGSPAGHLYRFDATGARS